METQRLKNMPGITQTARDRVDSGDRTQGSLLRMIFLFLDITLSSLKQCDRVALYNCFIPTLKMLR